MTDVVPKERQTAYERWEMASFGASVPNTEEQHRLDSDTQALLAEAREQIAAAREQAMREGLSEGLAQGYQTGMEQGRAQARAENALLLQLNAAFGSEIMQAKNQVAQDILALSLDVAKAMLKTTLAAKPDAILPIITEAINYLPTLQQPALLYLHAEDATLVREHMGAELSGAGWRIFDDATMVRGGCRIDTATNQIDASITSRWQRIAAALGQESEWQT